MSIHDKMSVDQVWVRPNANGDQLLDRRTAGQHFLLYGAPNFRERIEMTYRTIGNKFDWDLERFRLGPKASDKGNAWRLSKNVARFFKNPVGYTFWKTFKVFPFPKFILSAFAFCTLLQYCQYSFLANEQEKFQEWVRIKGGARTESLLKASPDKESRLAAPQTFIYGMVAGYTDPQDIVVNPSYKQNYRLYFDRMPFSA